MTLQLNGIWWLLLTLGPLLFLQRRLHREMQAILLLITRRMDLTLALFSLIFLPGVLVHEVSHYLMARLLGVRTGRFSIFPQPLQDGRLQMGYVETARTDLMRDALIGAAPFFAGGLGNKPVGALTMLSANRSFFTTDRRLLAQSYANLAAVAIQNAWLFEEVRKGNQQLHALSQNLMRAQEEERLHLSRELHDESGQILAALMVRGPA